jgi:ABC-type transport system involved in multi-copper enzyme maturation permease subunit
MTALTLSSRPARETAPRPVPWRNMLWVTWRQHRATLISLPAVFGVLAVVMVVEGLSIHHDWAVLRACGSSTSLTCQAMSGRFGGTDWLIANGVNIVLNLAPALIGVFAGVPLLARDLETGTYRYTWTQGIGRERWVIAKLVFVAVAVVVVTEPVSQLFSWFFAPFIGQQMLTMQSATVFFTHGVALAAWSLLAVTSGALAGLVLRQTMPAIAGAIAVYAAIAVVTWQFLRPHYPVHGFWPTQIFEASWVLVLSVLFIAATVALIRRRA